MIVLLECYVCKTKFERLYKKVNKMTRYHCCSKTCHKKLPSIILKGKPKIKLKNKFTINQNLNYCTIISINGRNRKTCKCICKCGIEFSRREDYIVKLINENKPVSCGCQIQQKRGQNHGLWTGYKDISGQYFSSFKCKAIKKNIPFHLTIEELWELFEKQGGRCRLTNIDLKFEQSRKLCGSNQTASLDRIDSSKGYTIDNVQWIHKTVNLMKNVLSQADFINWCKLVANSN